MRTSRSFTQPAGLQGAQGEAGAAGPQGSRGEAGQPGRDGADGADGQDGSPDNSGQILDKLRQVDGAGSNLNADLFDDLESSAFQRRGTATSCPSGQLARVLEADGDLVCTPDADTRYSAGTGLSLSGTQFSVTKAPDTDRLDGTDSSGFVRAYDTGAFRSARATAEPGRSGGFLSVPGFGLVSLLCSADGSVLSLRFTNTSGAPIAVLADYGATSPVYTVLDHNSTTVAAGGATDSVTFHVGADVGTSHRAATIWAAGAAEGTCMGQAQALAHTP